MEIKRKSEIDAIFDRYYRPPDVYDVVQCTGALVEFFLGVLDEEPRILSDAVIDVYEYVRIQLLNARFWSIWENILLRSWGKLNAIQKEVKQYHLHRAYVGICLSELYRVFYADQGAAIRWALMTQASDILKPDKPHENGGAAQVLQALLGMTERAFQAFNQLAYRSRSECETEGWNQISGFPEYIVLRFCLDHPEYSHLFAQNSNLLEFPLNYLYLQTLLEANQDDKSGKQLEDLASYLFTLIPGWIPSRNRQDPRQTFEHDIIVSNLKSVGNLGAELFGRHFLVECKNWQNRVGSSQVGYFLYRMHLTHCHFGIIFATQNITGAKTTPDGKVIADDDDKKAASNLIEKAFHEDHLICIVIDRSDITKLVEGQASFWSMLLEKTNKLRFGAAKSSHLD